MTAALTHPTPWTEVLTTRSPAGIVYRTALEILGWGVSGLWVGVGVENCTVEIFAVRIFACSVLVMSTFIRKKQSIKILKVTIKYDNKIIIIVIIRYTLK